MAYDGYDDLGDPVQHGLVGYQDDASGFTPMSGPCFGIVLSVNHSDSPNNMLYQFLTTDDTLKGHRASYLEASVLLVNGGAEMFIEVDNVVILQGKCSLRGPTGDEPADWTEDVPNGCTADELESFYAAGGEAGLESLSGDWCLVHFLGGILEAAVITNWFPHPRNLIDAATEEIGKRFVLRRNNSELQINKNGDVHLTHRTGQFLQMAGKNITIKHINGQIFSLDDDGEVHIQDSAGNEIVGLPEGGWVINAGNSAIEVSSDGTVNIYATQGNQDFKVYANKISLNALEIEASGGGVTVPGLPDAGGIKSLVNDTLYPEFKTDVETMTGLITALTAFVSASKVVPELTVAATAFETYLNGLNTSRTESVAKVAVGDVTMLTKVLKGE